MDLDALQAALAPRYLLREVDEFVAIADAEGHHIALGVVDPLVIQVNIGVVFMDPTRTVEEQVPEAHAVLEGHFQAHFAVLGFELGDEGDLVEGELLDDPEKVLTSWERPMIARPESPEALINLLDQVNTLELELVFGPTA